MRKNCPFRLDTAGRSGDARTVSVRRNQSSVTDVTNTVCWFLNCGAWTVSRWAVEVRFLWFNTSDNSCHTHMGARRFKKWQQCLYRYIYQYCSTALVVLRYNLVHANSYCCSTTWNNPFSCLDFQWQWIPDLCTLTQKFSALDSAWWLDWGLSYYHPVPPDKYRECILRLKIGNDHFLSYFIQFIIH